MPACSTPPAIAPHRMNATGYSLGTTFAPNWMDWPMFYHGNPEPAAPGKVFFIHIIIFDSERRPRHDHGPDRAGDR